MTRARPTQIRHESAHGHVTGRATYTDEQHPPSGQVSLYPVCSPHAQAEILHIDANAARQCPGVLCVLTAADIPGDNDTGPILHDEPLLPDRHVRYHSQVVAWVVGESEAAARVGAAKVSVDYRALPACLDLDAAIAAERWHLPPAKVARGDVERALATAPHRLHGRVDIGGQDHFYLETHSSWVQIDGEGSVHVTASTQHPSETQHIVARVLGLPDHRVICRCLRMGGGFGGKETQANAFAAAAALAAFRTGRPARIKLPRSLDMRITGKRHPFRGEYEVGFDDQGRILALRARLIADGGWSCDLSPPVLLRAMLHIDNAYFIPDIEIEGRIARTDLPSNTAFRGFGGPQGMLVGEEVLARVARYLGLPAHEVRERNFYRADGDGSRNLTPYGQPVIDNHLPALWRELIERSDFPARRAAIAAFNAGSGERKRGIAITPVKFGISFNKTEYNQAGALVHIYADGSIQLNHGGTEMGQGLHSKMLAVAAATLGVSQARIRIMPTSTDKVPNTSATAASSGSDLNGQAVKAACETLRARLSAIAAQRLGGDAHDVLFVDDRVCLRGAPEHTLTFAQIVRATYDARVSLSATGFYRTPGLSWDAASGKGHPFYYYAFGAAVSEVEVCALTGVHTLRRVDILHDVGDSILEGIDIGQIEGGFVQGLGWLTCEELRWGKDGRLLTDAPSTYKIPTVHEVPADLRVALFQRPAVPSTNVILHSKGVGEPPLMLALSVREALREAIAAFANDARAIVLPSPATPEAIWRAIAQLRNAA